MRGSLWASVLAACIVLSGCNLWKMHEETRNASAPAAAAPAGVAVTTRNGSVKIVPGDVRQVQITARLRARTPQRLAQMRVVAEESPGGVLEVKVEPAGGKWESNEGCAIEITTPRGSPLVAAVVRASNGRIEVAGVAGDVDAQTSNGSMEVRGVAGAVRADTSNGSIKLADIAGPVTADTSNGSINARLADDATGPVRLDTSNGSVNLEVGRAFTGTLSADTSNGSVNLPGSDRCTIVKKGRRSATIRFERGGGKSVIDTSNGSVTISCR